MPDHRVPGGYEQCPGSTAWVVDTNPAFFLNAVLQVSYRDFRHHAADVVRREELAFPVVAHVQPHEHFPKEVLIGFMLQGFHHYGKELRENLLFRFTIPLDGVDVLLLPFIVRRAFLVKSVGDCRCRHSHKIGPRLPGTFHTAQFGKQFGKLNLAVFEKTHCAGHRFSASFLALSLGTLGVNPPNAAHRRNCRLGLGCACP